MRSSSIEVVHPSDNTILRVDHKKKLITFDITDKHGRLMRTAYDVISAERLSRNTAAEIIPKEMFALDVVEGVVGVYGWLYDHGYTQLTSPILPDQVVYMERKNNQLVLTHQGVCIMEIPDDIDDDLRVIMSNMPMDTSAFFCVN